MENLLVWAEQKEITIVCVTETNIAEREGKILVHNANVQYKGYWASAAQDKQKGSGVGIIIDGR